ncbi:expressed unknown protein [Seminavis robusta]|uniref:Uncharacterized protein n=1 Tax=Seminavis robusta TaxID=568900 RepID=A0A9N8E0G0_9STRA|nr:expressed unknown protein [Seminavis robusta]|eukprot:Sro439_g143140.1 n/a (323) ;mRNA; f:16081-17049
MRTFLYYYLILSIKTLRTSGLQAVAIGISGAIKTLRSTGLQLQAAAATPEFFDHGRVQMTPEPTQARRKKCPFSISAFEASEEEPYELVNPGIDLEKVNTPVNKMTHAVLVKILVFMFQVRFALTKLPASGTKKLKSYDKDLVVRAFTQGNPKKLPKSEEATDGAMRWAVSRKAGENIFLGLIKCTSWRENEESLRLVDHFIYHKFRGQLRLEQLVGLGARPLAFLMFWMKADKVVTEFSRGIDMMYMGKYLKKGAKRSLAAMHKNMGIDDDLVELSFDVFMDAVAEGVPDQDREAVHKLLCTEYAMFGVGKGSQIGFLDRQ